MSLSVQLSSRPPLYQEASSAPKTPPPFWLKPRSTTGRKLPRVPRPPKECIVIDERIKDKVADVVVRLATYSNNTNQTALTDRIVCTTRTRTIEGLFVKFDSNTAPTKIILQPRHSPMLKIDLCRVTALQSFPSEEDSILSEDDIEFENALAQVATTLESELEVIHVRQKRPRPF